MRRTDAEFRDELERRKSTYFIRRKQKIRNATAGIVCGVAVILACGTALPMLDSGKSTEMANGSAYAVYDMEAVNDEKTAVELPMEGAFEGSYGSSAVNSVEIQSVKIQKAGDEDWMVLTDESQIEEILEIIQKYLMLEPEGEVPEGDGYEICLATRDESLCYQLIGDGLVLTGEDQARFDGECGAQLRALLEQIIS